ncbi:MAG: APC family permease [Candidatus Levyibacteriota bacterium]
MAKHVKLNQVFATAVCGNDILSTSLYVSGIAIFYAGVFAPLILLLVALILYFYKSVYTEIVEALPINGGAYNCLLNGTSKTVAAVAGVVTILSYTATAVISATVAVQYLHSLVAVPVIPATIILLLFFAALVISGMRDSARVALGIFVIHALSLVSFLVVTAIFISSGHFQFFDNISYTFTHFSKDGLLKALFFGFSASLLGVSGFESSANFVEEQGKGVFRKTLRNMLIGVSLFNPLITIAILSVSPIPMVAAAKEFLLGQQALIVGGKAFQYFIVLDAFLVLSGAVLTSFVGVTGLMYRMASDACLPDMLTKKNKHNSYPFIVLLFFFLCASILLITRGDLLMLAGMYTIAFLGVMSLFALGNLILRETRTELKRTYLAPLPFVFIALFATLFGIFGNIFINPGNLLYFMLYFVPSILVVLAFVYLDLTIHILQRITRPLPVLRRYFEQNFEDVTDERIVAFINHADRLHSILSYIDRNETAHNVTLVHCENWDNANDRERYHEIMDLIPHLIKAGVFPHLRINHEYINIPFGPEAVDHVSKKLKVRKNRIMIGSIHHFHEFDYSDLGGVRIIF